MQTKEKEKTRKPFSYGLPVAKVIVSPLPYTEEDLHDELRAIFGRSDNWINARCINRK